MTERKQSSIPRRHWSGGSHPIQNEPVFNTRTRVRSTRVPGTVVALTLLINPLSTTDPARMRNMLTQLKPSAFRHMFFRRIGTDRQSEVLLDTIWVRSARTSLKIGFVSLTACMGMYTYQMTSELSFPSPC